MYATMLSVQGPPSEKTSKERPHDKVEEIESCMHACLAFIFLSYLIQDDGNFNGWREWLKSEDSKVWD